MDSTSKLQLPYIMPSQAQKYVTHNATLKLLDCLVQPVVKSRTLSVPPAGPAESDGYIVAPGASGAWAGKDNSLACFADGAWLFQPPATGWQAYDLAAGERVLFTGTAWASADAGGSNRPFFGINTAASSTNRLAVASGATLFTHAGTDHRLTLNKAATGNTASLLLQTGYSGRAEIGLSGDDMLHVNVSPDGSAWAPAMIVDPATGWVGIGLPAGQSPAGPLHIYRAANVNPVNERTDNSASAPQMTARKARNDGAGNYAVVQNGDAVQNFFAQAYDGTGYSGCANLRWIVDGTPGAGSVPTTAQLYTLTAGAGGAGSGGTVKLEIGTDGSTRPGADNAYSLGTSSRRWSNIYAANGTISTSDRRDKTVIGDLGFAGTMVDAVSPVLYRWQTGGNDVTADADAETGQPAEKPTPRPGARLHAGFLAQDIKAAMDAGRIDFGAWGLDDPSAPESRQWLRPDQLLAVLWAALRDTRQEMAALKAR